MHKNELFCQKCAINCGIEGKASNENITKYKNLCGVQSISNSVQRFARYRIVALISIGRLCNCLSCSRKGLLVCSWKALLETIPLQSEMQFTVSRLPVHEPLVNYMINSSKSDSYF